MAFKKMFTGDAQIKGALPYGDKSVQQYLVTSGAPAPMAVPLGANQSNAETARLNRHQHQANNVTPNNEYKLDFLINKLDKYDVYTYHWKLFITSLENARSGAVLSPENQIIIAESGVSDLTIDKVELHGIAVPSVEAGTGTQTIVKFEIVEPSGAGLLDKLFYQATSLGIGNWLVMPCFLQLEFKGRDPVTSAAPENGSPGDLAALRWVWPLKLTNSKAHVTHVGTRYEFDAIMYDELAQSNSYFAIQHNTVLSNLNNFGDAMADLQDKLNADQYEKLIDNYSIPDTYNIIVDPLLAPIPLTQPTDNKSTAFGRDYATFNDKTASFNPGTGIDKIVDAILGNTEYFQKLMKGSETSSSKPGTANTVPDQMKKMWRVVTETKPIAFDMLRQDNAVEITIFIVQYDLGVADANASQTGQTPDTLGAEKRRFGEYINKKILRKKYNYIFTGLNDQILNFDLNMNFSFAASLSRFGGAYYDSAIHMTGVAIEARKTADTKATEEIRKVLRFINSANPEKDKDKKIQEALESFKNNDIDPILAARYTVLLNNAKPAARKVYAEKAKANGGATASGEINERPGITGNNQTDKASIAAMNKAAEEAKYLSAPVNGLRFISDVNVNSPDAKKAYEVAKASRKGKLRPIPYRESMNETAMSSGIDPASNSGRAQLASVFSTALYSTLDASLQSIKLTVKGDPYWLFPRSVNATISVLPYKSDMSPNVAISLIKSSGDPTSVNFYGSDNFILVRFRTPRIYNQVEGATDPYTEVETFSGVYKVVTVISKFEMGVFSQELTCILDPMINLVDFLTDIEKDAGKPTAIVPPPVTDTDYPETAIKRATKLSSATPIDTPGVDAVDPRAAVRGALGYAVPPGPGGGSSSIATTISDTKSNIPPYLRN